MSYYDSRIEALEIAFVELAQLLGRRQKLPVSQLPTAMNDRTKAAKVSQETIDAVSALARRLLL